MTHGRVSVSRRSVLTGLACGLAGSAFANPPLTSLVPAPRPADWASRSLPSLAQIIADAGLSGKTAIALADARSGQMIEAHAPLDTLPPASVTKAITALYALDALGPGFRFRTRLLATGPLRNGRLDGDLILAGGGDPTLDTNTLADMAAQLKASGLREITGRFRVADGALPYLPLIDPSQPDHVGYNPAISGLNLNFNRVYFEWKRAADSYDLTMDARSDRLRPRVQVAEIALADRDLPVFTYASRDGRDRWTVARRALGNEGGRWLPVRAPSTYTAEVFQTLARSHGIDLRTGPRAAGVPADATVLVEHVSDDLRAVLRGMLRYSTNITAEVVGLSSTGTRGLPNSTLIQSGSAMADWLSTSLGTRLPQFVDHSGLGEASQISPQDMVKALTNAGVESALRGILRDIPLRDAQNRAMADHPIKVVAKTGTLNFVSTLAGYIRTPNNRQLAFAIFSADMPRRAALSLAEREGPPGGREWIRRARQIQNSLLLRWGSAFDA